MIPSPMFEFGYHILKHTALCILLSYWWLIDLGGQNLQLTLVDCGGFFGLNCFDIEIFMWSLLDLETWDFYGWKVTLQAFLETKVDGTTMKIWVLIVLKFENYIRLVENSVVSDWTIGPPRLVTMKDILADICCLKIYFASFARFEDVGLLWLDSHFARVLEMKVDKAIDPLNAILLNFDNKVRRSW